MNTVIAEIMEGRIPRRSWEDSVTDLLEKIGVEWE